MPLEKQQAVREDHRTLADVLDFVAGTADLTPTRRRDLISSVRRVASMMGGLPQATIVDIPNLRMTLAAIRPAAHNLSSKSWANLKANFAAALELAGLVDRLGRGDALHDARWGFLMMLIAHDTHRVMGIAAFANWCARTGVGPPQVDDATVLAFLEWLEARTLHFRPRNIVVRVPRIWNELRVEVSQWPQQTLTRLSFRPPPRRVAWTDMPESFVHEAEAYIALRGNPDLFDERPWMPKKRLAPNTLRLLKELLQSAVSALVASGTAVGDIRTLADLVAAENVKVIFRHFHEKAGRKPNAFLHSLARALFQVAKFHVGMSQEDLDRLRRLIARLPAVPAELTEKNKRLLRRFESRDVRARLLFLPERLLKTVQANLDTSRLPYVAAQMSVAFDILLISPIRPENLCTLIWRQHFSEPDGPNGRLVLHLTADETKNLRAYTVEIPDDVARRLRWYRSVMLPRLFADPDGALFVSKGGRMKSQETISQQITEALAEHVGIHMTPHQFRHLSAALYLEEHPEDFETVRNLLNHASSKSTRIYAGSSSRRAGRAYSAFLNEKRNELKLLRLRKRGT